MANIIGNNNKNVSDMQQKGLHSPRVSHANVARRQIAICVAVEYVTEPLKCTQNDAELVCLFMRSYGFSEIFLWVIKEGERDSLSKRLDTFQGDKEADLVFYFSGHGETKGVVSEFGVSGGGKVLGLATIVAKLRGKYAELAIILDCCKGNAMYNASMKKLAEDVADDFCNVNVCMPTPAQAVENQDCIFSHFTLLLVKAGVQEDNVVTVSQLMQGSWVSHITQPTTIQVKERWRYMHMILEKDSSSKCTSWECYTLPADCDRNHDMPANSDVLWVNTQPSRSRSGLFVTKQHGKAIYGCPPDETNSNTPFLSVYVSK